jgi:hypothetical protein
MRELASNACNLHWMLHPELAIVRPVSIRTIESDDDDVDDQPTIYASKT